MNTMKNLTRREFVTSVSLLAGATSVPRLAVGNESAGGPLAHHLSGKAEHCIFIWLGGGASQIDTWDQKAKGDAKAGKPGSYYDGIDTAIPGVQVCKHLSRCAPLLDRFVPVRTVHHVDGGEHARATNRVHTGRPTAGTIIYPSIGSAVSHTKGPSSLLSHGTALQPLVKETADGYSCQFPTPGAKKSQLSLSVKGERTIELSVLPEDRLSKANDQHTTDATTTSPRAGARSFAAVTLPRDADLSNLSTIYADGMLCVTAPKRLTRWSPRSRSRTSGEG